MIDFEDLEDQLLRTITHSASRNRSKGFGEPYDPPTEDERRLAAAICEGLTFYHEKIIQAIGRML